MDPSPCPCQELKTQSVLPWEKLEHWLWLFFPSWKLLHIHPVSCQPLLLLLLVKPKVTSRGFQVHVQKQLQVSGMLQCCDVG